VLTSAGMRGFTLVEALVGLVLLLTGLAAAGLVLLQSVQHERESSNRRAATRLAASLADELRALNRNDGAALPADDAALLAWRGAVQATLPAGAVASVETRAEFPVPYVISIEWPVAGFGTHRVTLPVTP
jgi:Tfp pilus assembly protein PilV